MTESIGQKTKLKQGGIETVVWMTGQPWSGDKRNVNILTKMFSPPAKHNFYDENGKSLKPAVVRGYNRCMR
jgi:hypothetical protein